MRGWYSGLLCMKSWYYVYIALNNGRDIPFRFCFLGGGILEG